MSAIEMMDPKMDAGMIGNQVNRKVLNFEQAIKVSFSVNCLMNNKNNSLLYEYKYCNKYEFIALRKR